MSSLVLGDNSSVMVDSDVESASVLLRTTVVKLGVSTGNT